MKKRTLGKGQFDTVLDEATSDNPKSIIETLKVVDIDKLVPNPYQPREFGNIDNELEELANSIKEQGILQPVVVRGKGSIYEIIAGERRWRAAKLVGLLRISIIIKNVSDEHMAAFAIIENLQRKNLNPMEEASGYDKLITSFNLTHEEVAKRVGKSRVTISNMLRLLNLVIPVQGMLRDGSLTIGHARPLLSLPDDTQVMIAEKIVQQGLSVRSVEQLVNRALQDGDNLDAQQDMPFAAKAKTWDEQLAGKFQFKTKVHIDKQGKGRVVLHFDSITEGDWLIDKLTSLK